ncbi:hypothetical protein AYO47_05520 [Planctomyces sp. SCGC AG-212-M04]|nr:hypothetical protein AYO47_05520 [Planctomyces sp. SCGC AG-212-M04]
MSVSDDSAPESSSSPPAAALAIPSPARESRPFLLRLYNHNPFYAISAMLMLFAVRNAYGQLQIGLINLWAMLGVLGGYTILLALIGVLIVRRGKVWEDARSIFVVLLLLFLAMSLGTDDLFVKMESPTGGLLLVVGCYLFSILVTEAVFRGVGIRLGWLYRLPYHLLLALFFLAPWWVSPELHPRSADEMEWLVAAYPVVAGLVILSLLPAVRRGVRYMAGNGTPWPWPHFPWIGFGVLIFAHGLRSFAMAMTFGPRGPIWLPSSSSFDRSSINFDTMWGPYFLVPFAFGVLLLILEGSLASGNVRVQARVMSAAPLMLLLALPMSTGPVFEEFLGRIVSTVGSPLWLTLIVLWGFYCRAWLSFAPGAGLGVGMTTLLFSLIGPQTTGPGSLTTLSPWPWLVVGAYLLVMSVGLSTVRQAIGAVVMVIGLWAFLPSTGVGDFRNAISLHVLWGAIVVIGLINHDVAARILNGIGAGMFPIAAAGVVAAPATADMPVMWKFGYVAVLVVICGVIAWAFRSRPYRFAFAALGTAAAYEFAAYGYRGSASVFGRAAVTSFVWSLALLLTGLLISAHKAGWITVSMHRETSDGVEPPDTESGEQGG